VWFNFLGRDFYNALAEKDVDGFKLQLIKYLCGFVLGIPVFVFADYYQVTPAASQPAAAGRTGAGVAGWAEHLHRQHQSCMHARPMQTKATARCTNATFP
jgi:hypothetical protein